MLRSYMELLEHTHEFSCLDLNTTPSKNQAKWCQNEQDGDKMVPKCNKWKADAAKVVEYSKEPWKADTGDHVLFNAKTYHNTEQT